MRGIEFIRWILYADDVVMFCKSVSEAENLLHIINDTCLRFGLTISFKKTKTQVFNNNDIADKPSLFSIGDQKIENVQEFTYLGQLITTKENACFTDLRITRSIAKFNELRKVLTDTKINMRTRRKLLEACVRSRLTYGTQALFPNEAQLQRLEAWWHQLLRSMVKGGWGRRNQLEGEDDTDFSFVYLNTVIEGIVKTVSLRNHIYSQYLQYTGHICRSENTTITKKLLFAKPTRKYVRDPWIKIAELLQISPEQAKRLTQSRGELNERICQRFGSTP